ncbi:MAG: peptidoglycan DL-endopeptidase CwlO [Actinomycetota bacterium]|jgi:cell wall-associated NlpC family hydrolase|nr:peptidoglycan DL-endopeptidase CwlO [Actinomycetota bacterium]
MSLTVLGLLVQAAPAGAAAPSIPEWVKPAVRYLAGQDWIEKADFSPNEPMTRKAFSALMSNAFGGGFKRTTGLVRAEEVSAALVRALGKVSVADGLRQVSSPDGWHPTLGRWFGTEIVAREMGLRYNRLESEDAFETSAGEAMKQADALYAVWKAKTSPSTWSADALASFGLASYSDTRRKVVQFALSLVGTPYVWGGEWRTTTPSSYPYGAQAHGGFDCSGFAWYVLKEKSSSWSPAGRDYTGWSFPERSSTDMAKAATTRLGFKKLLPGDVVFFAPGGTEAKARDVYHAGIYLGNGWMVHSSGSRAGISLAAIGPGSWWNDQLAWGRRIITD